MSQEKNDIEIEGVSRAPSVIVSDTVASSCAGGGTGGGEGNAPGGAGAPGGGGDTAAAAAAVAEQLEKKNLTTELPERAYTVPTASTARPAVGDGRPQPTTAILE